ncbi:MAG: O-antigen ligase family protein [Coriobacteriia bacterium]
MTLGVICATAVAPAVWWTAWQGADAVVELTALGLGGLIAGIGAAVLLLAGEQPRLCAADIALGMYGAWMLAAALAADDILLALSGMRVYWDGVAAAVAVVVIYASVRVAAHSRVSAIRMFRRLLWTAALLSATFALAGLLGVAGLESFRGAWMAGRLGSLLGQPTFLAGWAATWIVPLFAGAVALKVKNLEGLALALSAILVAGMLLLTQSRSGWIAAMIAGGCYIVLSTSDRRAIIKRTLAVLLLAVLGGGVVIGLRVGAAPDAATSLESFVGGGTSLTRTEAWGSALRASVENPVFGTGPGTFVYTHRRYLSSESFSVEEDGQMADPHNWYLNALSTAGIPAGLAASAFALLAFLEVVSARGKPGVRLAAASGAFGYATHCIFTPNYPATFVSAVVLLAIALGVRGDSVHKSRATVLPLWRAAIASFWIVAFSVLAFYWCVRVLYADSTFGYAMHRFDDAGIQRAMEVAPEVSHYGIVRVALLGTLARAEPPGTFAFDNSLDAARDLTRNHAQDAEALSTAGTALVSASRSAYRNGDDELGLELAQEALSVLLSARELAPMAIDLAMDLAVAYALVGDVAAAQDDLDRLRTLLGEDDARGARAAAQVQAAIEETQASP